MKNILVCENCKTENPNYSLICTNCNSFLRARVPNIDLWATIARLIDNPITSIRTIIYADHKNFVLLLLILAAFKNTLNTIMFINATVTYHTNQLDAAVKIGFGMLLFISVFFAGAFIITKINKMLGVDNRLKDNIAIFTYSLIPMIILLLVLTPIYFAMYGLYWFKFNPSPFLIKPFASYIFLVIESLFTIWSCTLFVISIYVQTKKVFYSIIIGILFFITISISMFYLIGLFNSLII